MSDVDNFVYSASDNTEISILFRVIVVVVYILFHFGTYIRLIAYFNDSSQFCYDI